MKAIDLLFDLTKKLVLDMVSAEIKLEATKLTTRVRIERSIDECIARVIEPLESFFDNEGLDFAKQDLLCRVVQDELKQFLQRPDRLVAASLDGQTVFDELYSSSGVPRVVRDEQLEHAFAIVFPRVAH